MHARSWRVRVWTQPSRYRTLVRRHGIRLRAKREREAARAASDHSRRSTSTRFTRVARHAGRKQDINATRPRNPTEVTYAVVSSGWVSKSSWRMRSDPK